MMALAEIYGRCIVYVRQPDVTDHAPGSLREYIITQARSNFCKVTSDKNKQNSDSKSTKQVTTVKYAGNESKYKHLYACNGRMFTKIVETAENRL